MNKVRVLSNVIDSLSEVLNKNSNVFQKGYRTQISNITLSVTFTDQGDYYEAYIVSEPNEDKDINDSKSVINTVAEEISLDEDYNIAKIDDDWAELTIRIDDEKIRDMKHYKY